MWKRCRRHSRQSLSCRLEKVKPEKTKIDSFAQPAPAYFIVCSFSLLKVGLIATARGLRPRASEPVCTLGPSGRACGRPFAPPFLAAEYRADDARIAWAGKTP